MSPNAIAITAIVFLLAFAVYVAVHSGMRMARDRGPLRLYRLARAQALEFPAAESEADVRAGALAARRCASCAVQERCDAYLAKTDYAALRRICPNTAFLDRLAN
jgi:hypothetical protein